MESVSSPCNEPTFHLRRPLGYWANQLVRWAPGQGRCNCNNVTHITTSAGANIDLDNFKKAVLATVYNEPHLRADVDLSVAPAVWVPATSFDQVFTFLDLTEDGVEGVEGAWHLVELEANKKWKFGSGAPLYRCVLLKVLSGYIVMNIYHHAVGDGTCGMTVMGGIMDQYKRLQEGREVEKKPLMVMEDMENLIKVDVAQEVIEEMMKKKMERAETYNPFLPFDSKEMKENIIGGLAINKTLYRDGSQDNYLAIREKCRQMGVTVGVLALAASYLAMAEVHAMSLGQDADTYTGMKGQYIDIPVNIRHRLDPPIEDNYCGFYIAKMSTKCDVTLDTSLWGLAKDLQGQMEETVEQDKHLLFFRAKLDLAAKGPTFKAVEKVPDMMVSTHRAREGNNVDMGWGKVRAMYTAGSVFSPGFANYLLFVQLTDMFTYNLVHCPGATNTKTANDLLDKIVMIMEGAANMSETYTLAHILPS